MPSDYADKIVWVTGASSGIGHRLAGDLAALGATVAATGRREEPLEALRVEADATAGRVVPVPADLSRTAGIEALVERIWHEVGPIDICVLNAGQYVSDDGRAIDTDALGALFEVNFFSTVAAIAAVAPRMAARGHGTIAVTGSVVGYRGIPGAAAYGASKAALINYVEAIKPDLERDGITLKLINAGWVRTPMVDAIAAYPKPFMIGPEEAARLYRRALERRAFETTFPRRFTRMMKVLRVMPYWAYLAIARRLHADVERHRRTARDRG